MNHQGLVTQVDEKGPLSHRKSRSTARPVILTVIVALGLHVSAAPAQELDLETVDRQYWFQYTRQELMSEKWAYQGDIGYRELWEEAGLGLNWQRYHLRSNFSYDRNARIDFDLGAGGFYTAAEGFSDSTEIRTWLGATFYWPDSPGHFRRFVLAHRFRYEQRFIRDSGSDDWAFGTRGRYRIATSIAINRRQVESGAFYFLTSAELFARLNEKDLELLHNRTRVMAGLGWVSPSQWILEFRYIRQDSRDSLSGQLEITDKIIEFRVRTSVKIRDLMKAH